MSDVGTNAYDDLAFDGLEADTEVDALNEALPPNQRGYYARHMNGDVMWHEAPDRERCGGHGYIACHCGGDLCACGNGGEIECFGCDDCEPTEDGALEIEGYAIMPVETYVRLTEGRTC